MLFYVVQMEISICGVQIVIQDDSQVILFPLLDLSVGESKFKMSNWSTKVFIP
jgi:hypothetical protein